MNIHYQKQRRRRRSMNIVRIVDMGWLNLSIGIVQMLKLVRIVVVHFLWNWRAFTPAILVLDSFMR